jgi:hypothetical protein
LPLLPIQGRRGAGAELSVSSPLPREEGALYTKSPLPREEGALYNIYMQLSVIFINTMSVARSQRRQEKVHDILYMRTVLVATIQH